MYLRYGSFSHALNEAAVTIRSEAAFSDQTDQQTGRTERWTIRGLLHGDTQAALTDAINGLKAAYSIHGEDVYLLLDDGTETAHKIISNNTTSGVRIVSGPDFPEGAGAEYATGFGRSYEITLEAELTIEEGAGSSILAYAESLSFEGDGSPKPVFLPVLDGPWQKQFPTTTDTFKAFQEGSAVGRNQWPPAESPLFPQHLTSRQVSYKSPKKSGATTYTEWETTWRYAFEAVEPLSGTPHVPP